MKHFITVVILLALLALALFLLPTPVEHDNDAALPAGRATAADLAFRGVRVFDGETVTPSANVLVRDGRVVAADPETAIPDGAEVIEGAGRTLLPGLIDSHVHVFGPARRDAPRFGVTSLLDMFSPPAGLPEAKEQRATFETTDRADLFSAGYLATADGGHGTQYGINVPLPDGPDHAPEWVAERIGEGSDYIKIVIEDGSAWAGDLPTLDAATVAALVAAAHACDKLAVVHVSTLAGARIALEAGADGLVHVWTDASADEEFLARLAEAGMFVVPTTVVQAAAFGHGDNAALREHPVLGGRLTADQRQNLERAFPGADSRHEQWPVVAGNIRALHAAGIPILAGTDAPNPGTAHGVSLHRELALLVAAGLSPVEALAAATSVPAAHFDLGGRGCIKPGCRADLLLVAGDPTDDITATRDIVGVWKNGARLDLAPPVATENAGGARAGDDLLAAGQLAHWQASADDFMGGDSEAAVERGNAGLTVTGEVRQGAPWPWAGAMWMAADTPMQPVDLSDRSGLRLRVDGAAGGYRVMFFSGHQSGQPATVTVPADGAGAPVDITFADVAGLDPARLRAIGVFAPAEPGPFEFTITGATLQ